MKSLIYLVGVNSLHMAEVTAAMGSSFRVRRILMTNLVTMVYQEKPGAIVIIESDFDADALSSADAAVSLDYIPVICVSYSSNIAAVVRHMEDATYISHHDIDRLMSPLLEQAKHFADRYSDLSICNDTYGIMNEEIRDAMDIYVDQRLDYSETGITKYLEMVYRHNIFLDRKPSRLWLIKYLDKNTFGATLYDLTKTEIVKSFIFEEEKFTLDVYGETGFIKNENQSELSDITDIKQLIPKVVLKESEFIHNVACFASREVMVVAFNYDGPVRQSDLNILKALTVKLDMMVNIKNQMKALEDSFVYTMNALARAAEGKDDDTGHHIKRVNLYSKLIAEGMGMEKDFVRQIEVTAQMHDVGKIMIPDEVLNKPGKLTEDEYDLMKTHTVFGEKVIGESEHLAMAAKIARHHHEKYDGSGYPDGLKGNEIPLEARIVALADVYDALRSSRPYKRGFSHQETYDIIVDGDGRVMPEHFDPDILDVFIHKNKAFNDIYESLKDAL